MRGYELHMYRFLCIWLHKHLPPSHFPFLPPFSLSLPVCILISEINIKYLPQLFSYFLRQDISLNPDFINFDRLATQQTLVTLPLPLPSTGIVDTVFSLHFYMDVGDLNSGPTIYVASTLSTELFLYPLIRQALLFHLYR